MATQAEIDAAKAAGWKAPSGDELIRDGDNAITDNAVKAFLDLATNVELNKRARGSRPVPNGSNMNTYYGSAFVGTWTVSSTAAAQTILNMPKNRLGAVATTVFEINWPYGTQTGYVYTSGQAPTVVRRGRITFDATDPNAWSEWEVQGGSGTAGLDNVGQDNRARVDAFMNARGGSIGTGGVAAVALRFDHNMANFRDIVLPLLRERNLPWSLAVNTAQNHIDAPANGGVTWAQVQAWALSDGGEVLAHSHTHADSTTNEAIIANVVDSIPILAAGLPQCVVEGFAVPGTGGAGWLGWTATDTPEHFTSKYVASSAVLSNFAFCTGYVPGPLRPMTGRLANGQTHVTLDNATTASSTIAVMQQAQQMGAAVQLMLHPNALNLAGNITTAILTQILDWIVTERDAGRLVVLTTSGLLVADARSGYRNNILRGFGTAVWSNTAGWTFADNVATGTAAAGVMTGSVSLANLGHVGGRVRELFVEARSAAGASIGLGVTGDSGLSASRQIAVPSDNVWRAYRVPFTIPATGTSLTVELGRVSGGAASLRFPAIQSV